MTKLHFENCAGYWDSCFMNSCSFMIKSNATVKHCIIPEHKHWQLAFVAMEMNAWKLTIDNGRKLPSMYNKAGLKEDGIERDVQTKCDKENVYMAKRWQIHKSVTDLLSVSLEQ